MKYLSGFWMLAVLALLVCSLAGCERKTKEQLLAKGIELRDSANPTGAIVLFRNALEKDPNYLEARLHLGLAYLAGGNYGQAEKELAKVLLQDPRNGEVLLHLANVHLQNHAPDKAVGFVDRYLREQGESPLAFELLGKALAEKKDHSRAEQAYRKAVELESGQMGARNGLARLFGATGRLAEARTLLQESLQLDPKNKETHYLILQLEGSAGNLDEAIAAGRRLLQLHPGEIMAAYLVGVMELRRNDPAAAGQVAEDLLARYPKHPVGIRLQGLILYSAGEYTRAVEKFQQSVKQFPDPAGRYFLGLSHYQLGEFELALNQFQAMLDVNPDHLQARLLVAQTLYRQQRYSDSRAAIELVLRAEPDNALAHDILGSVFLALGDFDRGMAELDRAIALAPDLVDAQLKKGLFNLSQGKMEQAETQLEEAVRLAPELLNSRLLLAVSHLKRQNFSQAVTVLQEGLQGREEDAVLHNYMAAAYLGQGQTEKALAELTKAKERKPDYLAPYVNLANFHLSKSRPDLAAAEYQALLRVDSRNLRALLALAALQELQDDRAGVEESLDRAIALGEVEAFQAKALYQGRNGRPEQALATLDAGLELHPKNHALLELRSEALLKQGKVGEALTTLRTLAEILPSRGLPLQVSTLVREGRTAEAEEIARRQIDRNDTEARGYLLLAALLKQQRQFDQGIAILERGRSKVGNDPALEMARADLFLSAGQSDRARTVYEELRRGRPDYLPATFSLAALHDRSGDKRQALALYRDCLDKDEDYLPALNNLAYLYADNYRDLDQALDLASRAFRQRPADPGIMDTLGYVMVRQGRFADALPYLEKSAGLLAAVPEVQYHLALAYQGLGKLEEAEGALHKVMAAADPALIGSAETLLKQIRQNGNGKE